jgi:hypothetical protein
LVVITRVAGSLASTEAMSLTHVFRFVTNAGSMMLVIV